ncbi:hypothetical protein X777_05167 [Ooceraea biroi]|uniref:Uncharacterized protein n=1 Tax=Ooceraea biroi TaxID=2015173 RepID=A0A026WGP4_OOCBI|nr:hypothetical protein X777_05167 [Ooceraea biroi]
MDSLERLMSSRTHHPALTAATRSQNAFVQANLCSVIGRKGRHLNGTFCLTGDTMEGIIQCLVFLKAFSVRKPPSLSACQHVRIRSLHPTES